MKPIRAPILLFALAFSANALADLQVYDVDAKYRQEVFAALRGVLNPANRPSIGSVERLPSGQILVDTTPEVQTQVAAVLRAVAEHQSEPAPRVTLRYWAVLGSRDTGGASDAPEILSSVLGELRRVHGDLSFHVLGNATLVTESGQSGSLDGQPLSVRQQTFVEGDTLNANLQITYLYQVMTGQFQSTNTEADAPRVNPFQPLRAETQRLQLDTSLQRGEFVVVGENTIRQDTIADGELDGTIFYIVHWSDPE